MNNKSKFYKYFFKMAIVLVLQNVVTLSVNLADNMMLGAYSEISLSGVAAVNQIQFVYQMLVAAFGDGVVLLCTQYWGKQMTEPMKKIGSLAFRCAICLSVVLFLLITFFPTQAMQIFTTEQSYILEGTKYLRVIRFTYLFFAMTQLLLASMRSVETVNIAFYLSIMAFCINCGINYVLIYGHFGMPELGVTGAAIGTLCSRIAEFLVVGYYVLKKDTKLKLKVKDLLTFDHTYLADYFKVVVPFFFACGLWGVNTAMQTVILGHMNSLAIAANSVSSTLFLMVKSIAIGAAAATAVIIGKAVGEGDRKRVRQYSVWLQEAFVVMGILSGIVLYLIRIPVLSIYRLSDETRAMANSFLIILSITEVFMSYQMPTNFGIIKGGGDVKYTLFLDVFFILVVVIPVSLAAAFLFHASPVVVVICLNIDQMIKCIPAFIKCNYGNWIREKTK